MDLPPLGRLLGLLRPWRGKVLLAAVLAVLVALLAAVSVGMLKPAVEAIFDPSEMQRTLSSVRAWLPDFLTGLLDDLAAAAAKAPLEALVALLAAVALLSVLRGALRWGHETLVGTTAQEATADLLRRLFRSLVRQDVGHLQRTGAASFLSRFTADADALAKGLETLAGSLVFEPVSFLAYASVAFLVSWKLALLAVVAVPLLAFIARRVSTAVRKSTKRVLEKRQELTARAEESLRGIRVVQACGGEEAEEARFGAVNSRVLAEFRRLVRLEAATGPALELAALLGVSAALLAGGALAVRGEVSPGDLFAVGAALAGMYAPLRKIGGALNRVQGARAAAGRLLEVLDRPPAVADAPGAAALPDGPGRIGFEGVAVTYEGGVAALAGVDLEVAPGSRLAVVGASGSGKSTLLNLLPRFLDPTEGRVTLDGADLRGVRLADLRGAMALVPQEVFLHEGTIRENVLYGRPGATEAEVLEACRGARVDEIAARLPGGLDAAVGPAGALLSGGERQRVAVARAFLRDPRVLLLDEPTSALDARSEALVQEGLEALSRGRTTILVTHRAAAAERSDRVLFLEGGRVAGVGSHAALLRDVPAYGDLWAGERGEPGSVRG